MFTLDWKLKRAWLAALLILPLPLAAQAPSIITMAEEPHHHLALHNDYVNVYNAEAAPGDSLLLHRHIHDGVAIAVGEQAVTIGIPGKPDLHAKIADGQVRLQASGYVHWTRNDSQSAYHTIAVELLQPQTGEHNLCAAVLAGKPLTCPGVAANASSAKHIDLPQFESNQTRVDLVRVLPRQKMDIAQTAASHLIVALDPASISHKAGNEPDHVLRPGDLMWFDGGNPEHVFQNHNDKEVRFIDLTFKPLLAGSK